MSVTTSAPVPPIYWIASYPKSGNTFLRALLTGYLTGACDINNLLGYQDTDPYASQVVAPADDLSLRDEYLLRPAALLHLWHRYELTGPLLIKTHCADTDVDGVPAIPRQLCKGAVYLVRDPRCVAPSYAAHMGISVEDTIQEMAWPARIIDQNGRRQVVDSWSGNVTSWMQSDLNVLLVTYEDLRDHTVSVLREVLTHMGLPLDASRIDDAVELASLGRLQEQEAERGFIGAEYQDRFFGDGATEWRGLLDIEHAEAIERDHGKAMRSFGYAPIVSTVP